MLIIRRQPRQRIRKSILIGPRLIDYGPRSASGRGLYRILNAAEYRFFRSSVGPPLTSDTPFATHATLPYQPATTFADGVWYLACSYFDGVLDSGFLPIGPNGETYRKITVSGGVDLPIPPSHPGGAALKNLGGGVVQIVGYYLPSIDGTNAATQWAIAYTTDGSTPASGSPSITQTMTGSPMQFLAYTLPAQTDGTTVKVQLQVRRGTVYSDAGPVLSIVATAGGPSGPLGAA